MNDLLRKNEWLSWANWVNRSRSLICHEWPEWFAQGCPFDMRDLSDSLTVAHLSWAIWANRSQSIIWIERSERMNEFLALLLSPPPPLPPPSQIIFPGIPLHFGNLIGRWTVDSATRAKFINNHCFKGIMSGDSWNNQQVFGFHKRDRLSKWNGIGKIFKEKQKTA